jgi:Uma2 family endonuclease
MLSRLVPLKQLRHKTEIEIPSDLATSRYPDFVVLSQDGADAIAQAKRSIVRLDMPVPLLVGEVVSPGEPGELNYDRDYIQKRQEYALREIPEYWLIDPHRQVVLVLTLDKENGRYQEQRFMGKMAIASPTFPNLALTSTQVLTAGETAA